MNGEKEGVFGSTTVASPPAASSDFTIQASGSSHQVSEMQAAIDTIFLASMSDFSGAISLSCSGLPDNIIRNFNPGSATLAGSATAGVTLSISEPPSTAALHPGSANQFGQLLHGRSPVTLAFVAASRTRRP